TITFLFNLKHQELISQTAAAAVIVSDSAILQDKSGIVVDNPRLAMAKVLKIFEPPNDIETGIHPTTVIHTSAKTGKNVNIGAFSVIGKNVEIADGTTIHNNVSIGDNVIIGTNVTIFPQVSIHSRTNIGNNVIIDMGTVIGSSGYGYETENDVHHKIPQIGSVIIENDVEIGANCTIDRGTIGNTVIGMGTKLDNLIQIAHNVKIGKGCLLMGLVGIAGGTTIGDYCIFAGQCGVKNGITIGDRAIFVAKSGATKSLPGNKIYAGMPAREVREKNKRDAVYGQVIALKKRLIVLEEKLAR
ncbi:MAG: UDP-3-O-(3-hydroxymyristoyl)glucosamine N-acyltransferase, partial [Candidatus Marinimicrobia bacterium]|nr:UDP-3-O-(3-hydroxymyristoyl)glucosamine N-acyltransferase [Candidatus Neomarinimicrobiota bacterium]